MKNKGISLILLVITIIIIIIIASAVILNLNNNNPVNKARLANVQSTRDSLKSGINLYIGKIMVKENGNHNASTMILGKNTQVIDYSIIHDYSIYATIRGNLNIWQLDYSAINEKVNLKLDIYDNNSRWFIDEFGNPFLVYNSIDNVSPYLKNEDGSDIHMQVKDFVVVVPNVNFIDDGKDDNEQSAIEKADGIISLSETSGVLTYGNSLNILVENPYNVNISATPEDTSIVTTSINGNTITVQAMSNSGDTTIIVKGEEDSTHKATQQEYNISVWSGNTADGIPVSVANSTINITNIASYIGTKVEYHPQNDPTGVYRVFYIDNNNKYGDGEGTIYLKRDLENNFKADENENQGYTTGSNPERTFTTEEKDDITNAMKKMNPTWGLMDGVIDQRNEYFSSYLCNPQEWLDYKTKDANYAIGSPSVEMYMDAYNQWGGYAEGRGPQSYKFDRGALGYNVGINGEFPNNGYQDRGSLSPGPSNMFLTLGKYWWLSSPACDSAEHTLYIFGGNANVTYCSNPSALICPIISLKK